MAAPSSQILKGFLLNKHFYGSMPMLSAICGATIAVGDVLEETSGLLALADHDDAVTIVGVAKSAGVSGDRINYIPAWNGVIFEATLDEDTNTGTLLAAAQKFQQYGLGIDAGNGKPYINSQETTAVALTVVDFIDAIGASYGRVLVTFMQNKTVWGS